MIKVREPRINWGGGWTELKLEAFENYVNAYLKIMNAQKAKYSGWPTTIYFDGFAGSGERFSTEREEDNLFSDYFVKEDLAIYQGSSERVLNLSQKFDLYYFVDNDKSSIELLEKRLVNKNLIDEKCNFKYDDVNNQLDKLSQFINDKKAALVLLDPFGMQINWESIEKLKDKRIDLWILIPSGVIINRFLDKKGKLLFKRKLESYFGLKKDEIEKIFYKTDTVETLFGSVDVTHKVNDAVTKIAEIYIDRLKTIWKFVSDKPLELLNSRNVPIYHFVFASNNLIAQKIAKQIIQRKANETV